MPPEKELIIKLRRQRSTETLCEAEDALAAHKLHLAANRIYYALFYAVSALACKNGFVTSKHFQLMGWFNKEFIHTGKVSIEAGVIYRNAFTTRQESDYDDLVKLDETNLSELLTKVKLFLGEINSLLDSQPI